MPPVTKAGGEEFRKDVEFVAKDAEEQIATGIVMVPDKADLQHDFAREETIRSFADQFETFEEAGEAGGGIMHAAWPEEWFSLERNEVLDEATEIGGEEAPAGAWVQSWQFHDDGAWGLVEDGILEGYSIGAVDVRWDGPYAPDEVDDVAIPDQLPDGAQVWELTDGLIREVSAVDIPAVPDAQILDTKAAEKRLGDYLGNREGFIEEALDRGHTEAEAERLWEELNRAIEVEGAGEPGEKGLLARAGKAFLSTLTGSDDGAEAKHSPEAPDEAAAKEGRTLSTSNERSLMASIDASLDVLEDAGVDHGMTRFTDRDDVDFDLSEHDAREWAGDHDDEDDDVSLDDAVEGSADNDAPEGDTSDDTQTMGDDDTPDDPMADAPEWAKALDDRIDEIEGDATKGDADDPETDDRPEWAKDLESRLDDLEESVGKSDETDDRPEWAKELEERIDTIARQSGHSQQIDAAAGEGGDDEGDDGLDGLGKALS